jgi:RNA polymerase sigma-70 factor (ECF subfamily)
VAAHIGRFHLGRRGDTFRGWLRTITRNKIHDLYRRRRREPQGIGGSEAQRRMNLFSGRSDVLDSGQGSGASVPGSGFEVQSSGEPVQGSGESALGENACVDPAAERTLFRRGLELIRRDFEDRTWQAFWRTAVDGRATADVAAELGMSPGGVRVAKSRVLQRLRSELGDIAGSPRQGSEPA